MKRDFFARISVAPSIVLLGITLTASALAQNLIPACSATTEVFPCQQTIQATQGPWPQNLNPTFPYGVSNNGPPVVVSATPGQLLTVSASGMVNLGPGSPNIGANGDPAGPPTNSLVTEDGVFPAYYIPTPPMPQGALVGTFANNEVIVGTPFFVGVGPTHLTVPAGANQLLLGINDVFFSDNSLSFTVQITTGGGCQVSDLTTITDPDALSFEASAPNAPRYSLFIPDVGLALDLNMAALQSSIASRLGVSRNRTSGFRPLAYQAHLYQLKTKLSAVQTAIQNDPSQATACATLLNTLNYEIDVKHDLVRVPPVTGLPTVNPPSVSAHSVNPAQAIDLDLKGLTITQLIQIDFLASINGVQRPCRKDTPHFTLPGTKCTQTIRAEALSPVAILVTDPIGKRIGFVPGTNSVVNEIGPTAFYSGPTSEPQFVDIGAALPGTYTLTAVGTGTGAYTLILDRVDEDTVLIDHQQITGSATPGSATPPIVTAVLLSVGIDIKPGEVPNAINSRSSGTTPVAILSTSQFDAPHAVDVTSLRFGATGSEASLNFCNVNGEDVDGDGLLDLVCHFETELTGFTSQSTQGVLSGTTNSGVKFEGVDWVDIVH